ncbi:MAG: FAD:protein FMN transferase [Terriglobia bacterium]
MRYEASRRAMGSSFTIVAYGTNERRLAETADQAFEEIDRIDRQMSNYQPESELSALNRAAARRPALVEPKLFALIADSVRISEETSGAFDITVGPLMKAWGFFRGQGRVPTTDELAQVMTRVGYRHIQLDRARRTVSFEREGVELDLGGIAKGYAVDVAAEVLRANGVERALISSGTSSVYALGSPPDQRGWKVTIRDPFEAGKAADTVYLRNYSLAVSGSYEKFFTVAGKTYAHIMDPRTGLPVEGMLQTAVLAPTAAASDALSTACFVMGSKGSHRYVAGHPNLLVILYPPAPAPQRFKSIVLRSPDFNPPGDSLAEIEH